MVSLLSLLIGVVAGLRAMIAPAAVSWAAHLGWLKLDDTLLAFMGNAWTPWVLSLLAIGELITDKLAFTPSRTVAAQFGTRILTGALAGATLGAAGGWLASGAVLGVVGAVIGTLGGRAARAALARRFGKDRPAALLEDIVAIVAAVLIVRALV